MNIKGNHAVLAFLSRVLQPLEPPFLSRSSAPHISPTMFHENSQAGHKSFPCFIRFELSFSMSLLLYVACVPPAGKKGVLWIRRQRARGGDNSKVRISDSVAGCSAQNIIYSSHWGEITGAILFRSRKISWPGNTENEARRRVRHYNYYIASLSSLSVSIQLTQLAEDSATSDNKLLVH